MIIPCVTREKTHMVRG